ncbi:Lipin/Ned1/Smp2-domain-containing protein [Crucibulum laeve]|uniref:phosphatidate phosphatase n=1 Tax=Crucibulum laeve TaxID=68775 RepID=A0A5C3MEL3_9AGAR|nr:Lipin/Ned1/Smp2-domain-containing protein [Crucibulum laeve]
MNYIRGAVNAISAPYQYYRDLPPINPSTLTGAIDVIVIQRPTDNGDTELACSPFHVRFGKWQVLRPSEKKVNVSVNGHPIPFNMKIGEAGEAFFVFEADDDVPADLITSPILQPTRLDEHAAKKTPDVPSDRFGAKQEPEEQEELEPDEEGRVHTKNQEEIRPEQPDTHEPDYLDLDAMPSAQKDKEESAKQPNNNTTPKQTLTELPEGTSSRSSMPASSLPSPPPSREHSRSHTPQTDQQDKVVDEALRRVHKEGHSPIVEYHHDLALDVEGYHSHNRETSDQTITSSEFEFPSRSQNRASIPSPSREIPNSQSMYNSRDDSEAQLNTAVPFPTFRATSEPPPDTDDHEHATPSSPEPSSSKSKLAPLQVQEYSWEWGAFPQPSPMKATFGKSGRIEPVAGWKKGKGRMTELDRFEEGEADAEEEEEASHNNVLDEDDHELVRSRSLPPEVEGSPTRSLKKRRSREVREYEDFADEMEIRNRKGHAHSRSQSQWDASAFGAGGKLSAKKGDPTLFVLTIEGKKVLFELSLVNQADEEEKRGRKNRDGSRGVLFGAQDEVEASEMFEKGKIPFDKLLDDESILGDPKLVVRWAGEQYITRNDGSPLMSALVHWRQSALQDRENGIPSRPVSPLPSDEEMPNTASTVSQPDSASREEFKAQPVEEESTAGKKPTSSSWSQWWSRSRRKDVEAAKGKGDRPGLRGAASAPLTSETIIGSKPQAAKSQSYEKVMKESESAPTPSTPVQQPTDGNPTQDEPTTPLPIKKFAKTLRLTSDQLKALNLKPGANSITFSLSASGVIAATARIFVWDSTDLVVVSDIDGTITKSDGLGHVFAMIGRDWTHLGVAKLYTDIVRNGYKIMYLTSRAIGQADATRDYLKGIKQNDYQLPEGPVIMSPDRLMASLHREVIMRKPEMFKMACLRDIRRLFGDSARNPFYAGFGNRITDALSYRSVDVPSARIFTIDSTGEVKMELLELAGYKSSYIHMTDLVDQFFPPIHRKWTPEFTDFNFWKVPVQEFTLPDFSPPSPALSAHSDTSNQSALARLRNFSLGSRQSTMTKTSIENPSASQEGDLYRSTHLRQMSSFEKLSSTLGFMSTVNGVRRSLSPESQSSSSNAYADSDDEDAEDWDLDADGNKRKRQRRRSMTSMPGSLDDMHFGDSDEEEGDREYEGEEETDEHGEDEEAAAEEAFDEDLLAAGEMKNVPFL